MKSIVYTEQIFGVLGDRKQTILHYEDGTKRIIDHKKPFKKPPSKIPTLKQ